MIHSAALDADNLYWSESPPEPFGPPDQYLESLAALRASNLLCDTMDLKAMTSVAFKQVGMGQPDPMFLLKAEYDADETPHKVDLGAGVLRDEQGECYELPIVRKAKETLAQKRLGHDYRPTTGIASFREHAARLMFGENTPALKDGRIASIQTIAGTGACRIGAVFLKDHWPSTMEQRLKGPQANVFVGTPTWGNYEPLFKHAGFADHFTAYAFLDSYGNIDMNNILETLESAPKQSIFVFQGCCHNPTGRDLSQEQWADIATVVRERDHFAFFDTAYQGLGDGTSEDAWAVRHFADMGINMLVCQSFSKNAGLYSERVGALHVVCQRREISKNVLDTLRSVVRWEVSSAPAYGAELVNSILECPEAKRQWLSELKDARNRIHSLRIDLHKHLTERLRTPSPRDGEVRGWDHIVQETGLFSFTGLTAVQTRALIDRHHIYLPSNGRINVSGLSQGNILRVANAIDDVVRSQ